MACFVSSRGFAAYPVRWETTDTVAEQTYFFQIAGVKDPFLATIVKSVCGLSGVIISIILAQKYLGRRPMMLIGHSMASIFMLGIAHRWHGWVNFGAGG